MTSVGINSGLILKDVLTAIVTSGASLPESFLSMATSSSGLAAELINDSK